MLHFSTVDTPTIHSEPLWDAKRLGEFMGYTTKTITKMASHCPERLPPRSPSWKVRWHPDTVQEWAKGRPARKTGRPRMKT